MSRLRAASPATDASDALLAGGGPAPNSAAEAEIEEEIKEILEGTDATDRPKEGDPDNQV